MQPRGRRASQRGCPWLWPRPYSPTAAPPAWRPLTRPSRGPHRMPPPPSWSYSRPLNPEPVFSTQPLIPHQAQDGARPSPGPRLGTHTGAVPGRVSPGAGSTVTLLALLWDHFLTRRAHPPSQTLRVCLFQPWAAVGRAAPTKKVRSPQRWGTPSRGPGAPHPNSRPQRPGHMEGVFVFLFSKSSNTQRQHKLIS